MNDTRLIVQTFCDCHKCVVDRLGLHHHARTAAIRIIIRLAVFTVRIIPDIDRIQIEDPLLDRTADNTVHEP